MVLEFHSVYEFLAYLKIFSGDEQTFGCQVISLDSDDGVMKSKPGNMVWKLGDEVRQESGYYEKVFQKWNSYNGPNN